MFIFNRQFKDPVEKQIVVELFCVMGTIIRRHPELSFGENEVLDLPKLIDQAVEMYSRHGKPQSNVSVPTANKFEWPSSQKEDSRRKQFFEESVSTTSIFLAKATINRILNDVGLTQTLENAALSKYQ